MTATRTPRNYCLDCGKRIDAATAVSEDAVPNSGDISVCFYCGHIMIFAPDMTVRSLTDSEMIEIAGRPDIIQAMKIIGYAKKHR
jgi:hypothetical protein